MHDLLQKKKYHPLIACTYNLLLTAACRKVRAYIFVATTGRSGSASLAALFEAVDNAVYFHEPYPILHNNCPEGMDRQKYFDNLFLTIKRINIRRAARGRQCYLETNHQFVKNFVTPAMGEFQDRLQVIHLVRDPVQVAASFYRIGSIPGRSARGRLYLLDPNAADNFLCTGDLMRKGGRFDHDLYRCIWYWYEIETRIKALRNVFPEAGWHRMETEDINDLNKVVGLLEELQLSYNKKCLQQLVGLRKNKKTGENIKFVEMSEVEDKHAAFREEMARRYGQEFWH